MRPQTYGYLPSRKASPPIGWYQIILLGDRGTCVLTTCPGLHSTAERPGFEPATCWSQVQRPNHSATESFRGQLSPFHCLRSQTPQFRLELLWSHESEVNCGCYLYNLIYILAYIKGKGNNVELRELSGLESVSFMIKNGTLRCLRLVECKGDTACIKRCPIKTRYVGATEDIKCSDLSREDSQILNKCWRKVTVEKFM